MRAAEMSVAVVAPQPTRTRLTAGLHLGEDGRVEPEDDPLDPLVADEDVAADAEDAGSRMPFLQRTQTRTMPESCSIVFGCENLSQAADLEDRVGSERRLRLNDVGIVSGSREIGSGFAMGVSISCARMRIHIALELARGLARRHAYTSMHVTVPRFRGSLRESSHWRGRFTAPKA